MTWEMDSNGMKFEDYGTEKLLWLIKTMKTKSTFQFISSLVELSQWLSVRYSTTCVPRLNIMLCRNSSQDLACYQNKPCSSHACDVTNLHSDMAMTDRNWLSAGNLPEFHCSMQMIPCRRTDRQYTCLAGNRQNGCFVRRHDRQGAMTVNRQVGKDQWGRGIDDMFR